MKLLFKIEQGGLNGSLYSEKYGFIYKVKFQNQVVARSYCYFKDKEEATRRMESDMSQLLNMSPLFDINEYKKE